MKLTFWIFFLSGKKRKDPKIQRPFPALVPPKHNRIIEMLMNILFANVPFSIENDTSLYIYIYKSYPSYYSYSRAVYCVFLFFYCCALRDGARGGQYRYGRTPNTNTDTYKQTTRRSIVLFRFHARRRPLTDLHDSILCQSTRFLFSSSLSLDGSFEFPWLFLSLSLISRQFDRFYDCDRFEFPKSSIIDCVYREWAS